VPLVSVDLDDDLITMKAAADGQIRAEVLAASWPCL